MFMTILIWASLICGIALGKDALVNQAVILACATWIVSEIRKLRPTPTSEEE